MTRRAETIVTLVGAGLLALTTLGLYLLDLGDWPVVLIGIGALLALGAISLHAAAARPRRIRGPVTKAPQPSESARS